MFHLDTWRLKIYSSATYGKMQQLVEIFTQHNATISQYLLHITMTWSLINATQDNSAK